MLPLEQNFSLPSCCGAVSVAPCASMTSATGLQGFIVLPACTMYSRLPSLQVRSSPGASLAAQSMLGGIVMLHVSSAGPPPIPAAAAMPATFTSPPVIPPLIAAGVPAADDCP